MSLQHNPNDDEAREPLEKRTKKAGRKSREPHDYDLMSQVKKTDLLAIKKISFFFLQKGRHSLETVVDYSVLTTRKSRRCRRKDEHITEL
jgi:hypothetical protein